MALPRYARLIAALLLVLSLPAGAEPVDFTGVDPADHTHDRWYLDTVGGKGAGYWRSWLTVQDDRVVTGYEEMRVETHAGEKMTSTTRVVWTETLSFKPLNIVVEKATGSDTVTQAYTFSDKGITLTSKQAGRSIKKHLPPIKGGYLTAAQREIATTLHLSRGDKAFEFKTLDPLVGMTPYITHYERVGTTPKPYGLADGSEQDATRWTTTFSVLPGFEMQTWINAGHETVGVSYRVGPVERVSRLADASVAERAFDPPELAHLSVVVPDKPIEKPGQQKKIVYELSYDAGDGAPVPVSIGFQSVEALGKGRARVTVDLGADPAGNPDDKPTQASLSASIRIDHRDQAVRRLAGQAVAKLGEDATAHEVALACKRAVANHLHAATMSVGDATASEAARTGKGDCTESAVLLAALLRANDIPSRCVTGLAYSEEPFAGRRHVFVYHQWTQAWIADAGGNARWVDLDAAMWRYSAGHIALGVSNMGDNDQQDQFDIIPMMQGLTIKILDVSK